MARTSADVVRMGASARLWRGEATVGQRSKRSKGSKGKERKGKERKEDGSAAFTAAEVRLTSQILLAISRQCFSFAVVANHARDVLLRPLVHDVHRGERARRPHAHVQRPVVAEREPALGRVEMHRRYPEVEKDRVHLPVQLELVEAKAHRAEVVHHRVELEHARAPPRPRLGDLRRRRADCATARWRARADPRRSRRT